jgi:hypothetical protein
VAAVIAVVAAAAEAVVAPVSEVASSPVDKFPWAAVPKYLSPVDTEGWRLDQLPERRL